jgi:hypothetical protein
MNADENTDCAGRWRGRLSTGLSFYFFLGPQIAKFISKNSDFGWVQI